MLQSGLGRPNSASSLQESPPVSPKVVAAILMIQKISVTSGTLLKVAFATSFMPQPFLIPAAKALSRSLCGQNSGPVRRATFQAVFRLISPGAGLLFCFPAPLPVLASTPTSCVTEPRFISKEYRRPLPPFPFPILRRVILPGCAFSAMVRASVMLTFACLAISWPV